MYFHPLLCGRALLGELLSNDSLFVCQLYEGRSLKLHASDLIFFTTLLLNSSLLELSDLLLKYKNNINIDCISCWAELNYYHKCFKILNSSNFLFVLKVKCLLSVLEFTKWMSK